MSESRLSTKLHASVDALGSPTGHLPRAWAERRNVEARVVLKDTPEQTILFTKSYGAQAWLAQPLLDTGNEIVIPSRSTNKRRCEYHHHLKQARSLLVNFFARLNP